MTTEPGQTGFQKRIAINVGAGHVPGINAVILGAAIAAGKLGWELVGIRDGFDGLLYPDRYPDSGLMRIEQELIDSMDPNAAGLLGQANRVDPFHVRRVNEDDMVEEIDMSDEILARLEREKIDALVSVVGGQGMSILYKLQRKGLNVIGIPRSIENNIASTSVSFGFNTSLSFTIDMLDRVREAAQSAHKIAVVEVLGEQSGWLALQAGIAVCADAVVIPEISCDLKALASKLKANMAGRKRWGLVVVAEGAQFDEDPGEFQTSELSLKATLSPLATGSDSENVIRRSGQAADIVANSLQLQLPEETFPMVLGPWARGGTPTAVDRQLALGYGAGAIKAVKSGSFGSMVAFVPPNIEFIPLIETLNKVRTVPRDSEFVQIAQSLDIFLGREVS